MDQEPSLLSLPALNMLMLHLHGRGGFEPVPCSLPDLWQGLNQPDNWGVYVTPLSLFITLVALLLDISLCIFFFVFFVFFYIIFWKIDVISFFLLPPPHSSISLNYHSQSQLSPSLWVSDLIFECSLHKHI